MIKAFIFLFASIAIVLLGFNAIPPQPQPTKTIKMQPIQPTPIAVWIDTCSARYNVPKQVILGVGWNESHLGQSKLAQKANNWFGIKCGDGWTGDRSGTWRKYASPYESVEDFCRYIHRYYSHLIGKPLERWVLRGYKKTPYKF